MPVADVHGAVEEPFPGLRPFQADESLLFFGREPHVEHLLRSLAGTRFLAVVGSSGSGKSSLVRAGLLPALYRGYLAGSTTGWRIAVMRPGTAPLANLCSSLASPEALGAGDEERRAKLLSSSSLGLVEAVEDAGLPPGESVLLVVDQFEELFRYRRQADRDDGGAEAGLFVSLLLAAVEQFDASIYVVLTMRSDFLGECAEFPGLAEALSRSQYLIPRLTREQRSQAIGGPLRLAGAGITTRCLQQLLNDSGEEPAADPLPVLQHALARTFRHWTESGGHGSIDLPDYQAVGGMAGALNAHAEWVYDTLDDTGKFWVPKIFRTLTTTELGRRIRRPTRLDRLYRIVGAATDSDRASVDRVLGQFLDRSNSLLASSSRDNLRPDTVLDIPHESLITKWSRLEEWTRREASSAEWYMDVANAAALFAKGEGALWRDPNLVHASTFAKIESWNEDWAAQYRPDGNPGFTEVQGFLRRSRTAQQRQRVLAWAVAVVVLVAFAIAGISYYRAKKIEESNRGLLNQMTRIQADQAAEDASITDYQSQLKQLSSDQSLSALQRARREQQLQDKLDNAQKESAKLQAQRDQTAAALKNNSDVAAVNGTLQDRLTQLQTKYDSTEKQRQDAVNEAATLRKQLDAANQELTKLKTQPVEPSAKPNSQGPSATKAPAQNPASGNSPSASPAVDKGRNEPPTTSFPMSPQVAIVSQTPKISFDELKNVAAALQIQISRDFKMFWNADATVTAYADLKSVPPNVWPIICKDEAGIPGALGYHAENNGQPSAIVGVQNNPSWTLTASHELINMLADPHGNRTITAPSPDPADKGKRTAILVEPADPAETPAYSYQINGITVSDFVTPAWFESRLKSGTLYSFRGSVKAPGQVLPGGYMTFADPVKNVWRQIIMLGKKPEIHTLDVSSPATSK